MRPRATISLLIALAACSGATPTTPTTTSPAASGPLAPREVNPADGHRADAPEISRSLGQPGGVVVFWPRISPRADAQDPALVALAQRVQQRLESLAHEALPGRDVDVRPAPERVCPRAGCTAMTLGATVTRVGRDACAVVAVVSASGPAVQRLIPWVGDVRVVDAVVPFREPPESHVTVTDYASCATAGDRLADHADALTEAIRAAAPPGPR